jgi:hypothetical protein
MSADGSTEVSGVEGQPCHLGPHTFSIRKVDSIGAVHRVSGFK